MQSGASPSPELARPPAFSERLREAARLRGVPLQPSAFARWFNDRSGSRRVSMHAVRKWLLAESCPVQERVLSLANLLHVDPTWLRFGTGSSELLPGERLHPYDDALLSAAHKLSDKERDLLLNLAHLLAMERTTGQDAVNKARPLLRPSDLPCQD